MLARLWRNAFTLLVGVQISSTVVEDSVMIPQKRKQSAIPLSNPITGYLLKGI